MVVARVDAVVEGGTGHYEVEAMVNEGAGGAVEGAEGAESPLEQWGFGDTLLPRGTVVKVQGLTSAAGMQ